MAEPLDRVPNEFRLNLEQQKKRARELLNRAKDGDPAALARLAVTRDGRAAVAPKLADAQFAIARELRFPSWARLKAHIVAMDREAAAIARHTGAPDAGLKTLHLRCGHDIQHTLAEAGFAGDFHAHVTPYCQGPVTTGPNRHELMARFIVDHLMADNPPDYEEILAAERLEDEVLARMGERFERIVIWMEHDSYDQLILVRLLAHFATAARPRVLELIAVNEYPGGTRFVGLGQLPPESLRLLWEARRPVTEEQLALGEEAWTALASPDPRPLAALAASGATALPILAPALHRHLRELPSIENGLGLTEHLILQALADDGTMTFGRLFWLLQNGREPLPYLGDSGVASITHDLERASESPIQRTPAPAGQRASADRLTITDVGRALLAGARDWHDLHPPPRWVGGVHVVPGEAGWRWNEATRTPVSS